MAASIPATPTSGPATAPAASAASNVTEDRSTPAPPDSQVQLSILIAKRSPDDVISALKEGGKLTSRDHYGIFFRPAVAAYVYIFQKDSSNSIDILFPNTEYTPQANPVPGGVDVWLPQDVEHWFRLDETTGQEAFVVVASRGRNQELESILGAPETMPGKLAEWLSSADRGVGGVVKIETKPVSFTDGTTEELAETLVRLLEGNDKDLVYQVEFMHD